jgi:hypothetical protein
MPDSRRRNRHFVHSLSSLCGDSVDGRLCGGTHSRAGAKVNEGLDRPYELLKIVARTSHNGTAADHVNRRWL